MSYLIINNKAMKSKILTNLAGLMNAGDLEERVNLQIKASCLIEMANFGLDKENETLKKNEIISFLDNYIECPDEEHKDVLLAHIAFIEAQNVA